MQLMRRQTLTLATAALIALAGLSGCSHKNDVTDLFTKDRLYEKSLMYTREDQIVRSFETKAAIRATLLNEVFPKRYSDEKGTYFFVGIVTQLDPDEVKKNYHIVLKAPKKTDLKPKKTLREIEEQAKEAMLKLGKPTEEAKKKKVQELSPVSIRAIAEDNELYKLMPNVNRWGKYFLVTFPPTDAKRLPLEFGIYPYGTIELTFQRPTRG